MNDPSPENRSCETESGARDRTESRTWQSEQLLGDRNEAFIRHGDDVYRLLRTRNGKLILVK
jgi:hemin uptake protein HemP